VYFAQTTLLLPFGPAAALPLARAGDLIRRAAGVIVVSQYLRDYFRRWAGIEATVIRPPVFGLGPFPRFGSSSRGFVTIVNPSAVKGIDIFLMLVAAFPEVEFAAVVGWGTTQRDRAALESLPNVQLLPAADDLADVFRRSRVLVMPSLWAEAFGCVAIEAMLHGIPVLASDVGGLPEAKLGVDYVLPVRPIERYTSQLDDQMMPMPIVPPQDGAPWIDALRELLTDAATYERVAERSRSAATQAVADIGARPFVDYFEALDAAREGE
jgi:glycosyltransferase involved in cell wall biosynthesis